MKTKIVDFFKAIWKSIVSVFNPIAPTRVEQTVRVDPPVPKVVDIPVKQSKPRQAKPAKPATQTKQAK